MPEEYDFLDTKEYEAGEEEDGSLCRNRGNEIIKGDIIKKARSAGLFYISGVR